MNHLIIHFFECDPVSESVITVGVSSMFVANTVENVGVSIAFVLTISYHCISIHPEVHDTPENANFISGFAA